MGDKIKNNVKVLLFLISALPILISGCSIPRIIVIKDPLTPEEHINLGVAYEKEGEFDQAIKEYRLASKKLPIAYFYLGNVHFQKEQWGEAETYYKKAIKKAPQQAEAYNNLAWLYYIRGENLDQAEALVLKAIELNSSKGPTYRDTLEKIREKKGR